ncbi:ABC transporter ATP-binding protein [Subtercola boreus]|uniref:ABC transporter ATP-binding protein n=1 Tax=Subtercola boreus TaxID=120213 RepID=A0A3E0VIB2_9MICO|nr:ABC transporter ATP-binding protein [Subtercola boreus]RFA09233.1 ABC transporter ATP-binding protein [Subtercola boreus]TQL53741.1 peptide/nickel transport system ATP-binding protein [Subtercola boreus]
MTAVQTSTRPSVIPLPQAPLLEVDDLRVTYTVDGERLPAVDGVSFTVSRGETVAIVGESGSGKSTTAHAILHLLAGNARVSSGAIRFGGRDLTGLSRREWRAVRGAQIGLIPQDPATSLDPLARVGAQVAEVLRIHHLASRAAAASSAIDLLALAGIPDAASRARQYPHQFSGGMKQRALIAAALAADPHLVIADEPTSALDVTVQRQVLDHLDRLVHERDTALLFITHDLGVAADRADRIIVMQHGRIVESGPTAQILGAPSHPYTRALIAAAPSLSSARLRPTLAAPALAAPTLAAPALALPTPPANRALPSLPRLRADARMRQTSAEPAAATVPARDAPLLVARGLRKEFPLPRAARGAADAGATPRTLVAVDDVSFEIARGETFALVGESGSGKSTTARLALRLETPTAGELLFDGADISAARGEALRQHRRRFQLVYQSPYASLDPRFTVADIIDEPLRAYGVGTPAERRQRVLDLLEQVALPASYATRKPAELSGGQRQRVAIARALALRPDLVVLDEAVSALDVSVQAQVLQLLTDLQAETGVSYLFISHDLAVVRQLSDRVGVMSRGKLVEVGDTRTILESPQDPYTRQLIDAIPGTLRRKTEAPS